MSHILRTLALPAVLVGTLALASCGSSPSSPAAGGAPSASSTPSASASKFPVGPPAKGASNAADAQFATTMISHHLQAVAMADLAPTRAGDAKIKALAPKITESQGPEITRMSGWLAGGNLPVPTDASGGSMAGHDMSGMGGAMPGMMTPQEMTNLSKASGSGFDRMWLQMMIKHHQGAVATAKTELAKGLNPDAKKLAQSIIDEQSAEIVTIKSILAGIPG